MDKNKQGSNESSEVVSYLYYISDIETYELYCFYSKDMGLLTIPNSNSWAGQKCYKVLQGKDSPCEFCNNSRLEIGKTVEWKYYNPILKKDFLLQDTLVELNGRKYRLEVATHLTDESKIKERLVEKLREQQTINSCIEMLHSSNKPVDSINLLLAEIANYYLADRSYIFEFNYPKNEVCNTYEWCNRGVSPQIDNLQNVSINDLARWMQYFNEKKSIAIDSIHNKIDPSTNEYKILNDQGIDSLLITPIFDLKGSLSGFIGVDDPQANTDNLYVLETITKFIADFLDKNLLIEKLKKLSYTDSLTGLKNHHSYSSLLSHYESNPPNKIGIAYIDMNDMKIANDNLGHKGGDLILVSLSKILMDFFPGSAYRIGGDEFVVLVEDILESDFYKKIISFEAKIVEISEFTASVGAVWKERGIDIYKIIEKADNKMYQQKLEYHKTTK